MDLGKEPSHSKVHTNNSQLTTYPAGNHTPIQELQKKNLITKRADNHYSQQHWNCSTKRI